MKRTGKALVLGNDVHSFLAVVRSLGRKGIEVHTAWASPGCPTIRSRYVRKHHCLPRFVPNSEIWICAFEELLRKEGYNLVVPCGDRQILPLQKERERLTRLARIEILDQEVQEIVSSKQASYDLALRLGVPVVPSFLVQTESELDEAIAAIPAPYVIKPVYSFTLDNLRTRNEVRKAFSAEEAKALGSGLLGDANLQIQQNFAGVGTGVEFLAAKGEVLAI